MTVCAECMEEITTIEDVTEHAWRHMVGTAGIPLCLHDGDEDKSDCPFGVEGNA